MTRVARPVTLVASIVALAACAATPPTATTAKYRWAETDLAGHAPGQAYAAAAMFPRLPMPDHRDFRSWEFYFKHCSRVAPDRPYVSKTQYDCNGPY